MALPLEPPPLGTPLIEKSGLMQSNWITWLLLVLLKRLQAMAYVMTSVTLLNQHAAIGATALVASAAAGVYRVSWRTRITTADGAGSAVTLTITSIEGGNTINQSGAAVNGDTLQTVQSGDVLVDVDAGSLLSYSATYASTTPAKMGYKQRILVERLS